MQEVTITVTSSEVGHHITMAQKALILSKLHVFCLQSHQRNQNYPKLLSSTKLVGLVENKIDNKIKLIKRRRKNDGRSFMLVGADW